MKVSTVLAFLVSAMAVTAVPMADIDSAAVQMEARDPTQEQCKEACDTGVDAVEEFCRLIRDPRARAACLAAAAALQSPLGQLACEAFCEAFF